MRFRSPEDPEIKSTQELIVLQIASDTRETHTRRVLVRLPGSYEDLVTIANQTFDLAVDASGVRFYTQEIAGNKGVNVEITSDAWDAVKTVLTSVIVEPSDTDAREPKRAPRKSVAPPQPDRVITHDVGAAPTKDVIDAARRLSRMSLAPEGNRRRTSRRSFAPLSPPRSTRVSQGSGPRKSSLPPNEEFDEENDEFEEEESVVFRSRSVGRRQVIASEDEEDEEVEDELHDELHEDDGEDDAVEGSFVVDEEDSASPPRQPSPQQQQSPPPSQSPKAPVSKTERRGSEQRNVSQAAAAPSPKIKQERDATGSTAPKSAIKEEPVAKPQASEPPFPHPRVGPDERFVVIIEYDDGTSDDMQTMFKTRGRHTVSKVLTQACRTFDIDDLYDRAQLLMVIDTEEDGEIVEHRYICPKTMTMANVGAEPEARFIVQVDDEV
ncbi:uncharacterized protein C8Q71DRAFT_873252 [Rhodofomes roseus]|uniref:Uncharacterized protein n=1 Tax=Rhodofomes roseus TaxID=34475 RepID=A0ABQ8K9I9_9APHY|nr:uncharacterized protein C8Q71DRAFT_873252 [Rhodofomes roseus]KAH9833963.1 hypothetical protein C8Q71DRAFT_873252 [Rhodofomes roseus]